MASKHLKWRQAWLRDAAGLLSHASGLRVHLVDGRAQPEPASLAGFEASELARGVQPAQLNQRLQRLLEEAQRWQTPIQVD